MPADRHYRAARLSGARARAAVKPASWRAESAGVGFLEQLAGLPIFGRSARARPARYRTEAARCGLGAVLDVSASGCRVRCDQPPALVKGQGVPLRVQCGQSAVSLSATVAWARRVGGAWQMGLRFTGVTAAQAQVLRHLCEYGFLPEAGRAKAQQPAAATDGPVADAGAGPPASVEIEDLYAVLGVDARADGERVRRAYHALAQELHPDRNPSPAAAERFALASKAYSVLRDARARERYDAMLAGARRAA